MDVRVSRKEKMWQQDGPVEVLKDNIFDLFPVYSNPYDPNLITDIEMIEDEREDLLGRALFAIVKQRGMDPLERDDGIPWAETITGEVPSPVTLTLIQQAVMREGPGVRVIPSVTERGTSFKIELTN